MPRPYPPWSRWRTNEGRESGEDPRPSRDVTLACQVAVRAVLPTRLVLLLFRRSMFQRCRRQPATTSSLIVA
jgi:hypothetical protein